MTTTPTHRTSNRQAPSAVRDATSADLAAITTALASAFADDPVMRWCLGPSGRPEERLAAAFRAIASTDLREDGHEIHLAADGSAVAMWRDVGHWKASPSHLLRVMPGLVRSFRSGTWRLLRTHALIEKHHPDEPHRYLECLGTRADAQGRGLGSAVLGRMLQRCDQEGVPVYAESSNPRNLAFYFRHGFVEHGDPIRPRPDAPPVFPIWRDPR